MDRIIPFFENTCATIVVAWACAASSVMAENPVYRLAWSDEFNGTAVDTNRWERCPQAGCDWALKMSPRADLVEVRDGSLILWGKRNTETNRDPRPILTGGVQSPRKGLMGLGKAELRVKLESHQKGAWPALWMLGDVKDRLGRGWPWAGEIDIVERLNGDPFVYQTVHSGWTYCKKHSNDPVQGSHSARIDRDGWNVYGLEVTPKDVIWTVNGAETFRYPRTDCGDPDQWPFGGPAYFLLDMQLGGKWVGAVEPSTLPVKMMVDWIRVYDRMGDVRTVYPAPGYNSWPMIGTTGDRLVCVFSRGSAHSIDEGARDALASVSTDGGRTWGKPVPVAADPAVGEVPIGKGRDSKGAMLAWIRRWGKDCRHDLYRTADGVRFERIASLRPNPMPMQITDVFPVGKRLLAFWFACSYGNPKGQNAWGLFESADDGRTWTQRVIERDLAKGDVPTEQSGVHLGDGRILAIGRCEDGRAQFQLTSVDGGKTWTKRRTNIADVLASTPSLVYEPAAKTVSNYYYQRGAGLLKVRVANVAEVFDHPDRWPAPRVLAADGAGNPWDAGNANAVSHGGRHVVAWYAGDSKDTSIRSLVVGD